MSPRPLGNKGGKSVSVNYKFPESQGLITIQTPWMRSYGIGKWIDEKNSDAAPKYSISINFGGMEEDEKISQFHDFLEQMDQWAISTVHKNSFTYIGVKNIPKETVAFNYNPSFKTPTDKATGEPTGKPDYMKLKINIRDDVYNVAFFNKEKARIDDADVESTFLIGSRVRALIQCSGFWIVNGKYGLTWNLKQMIIDPPARIGKTYAFNDDDDEDMPAKQAVSKKDTPVIEKQELAMPLEIPDSDSEELASPAPTEKKVIKKVVKKNIS